MSMTLAAMARAMGATAPDGQWGEVHPTGVQTDSRVLRPGELFFCIPGERFDGHDFAAQALELGACAVVAERELPGVDPYRVLRVDTVLAALGRLARAHRDAAGAVVIGVTGSAGKTTVKELLAAICSQVGPTAKNHLNLNNQIGLPVSMLKATGTERFWVFEAGINYEGEMDLLGGILAPDFAVIVNVGGAHTEGLGGLEGVARNKALLLGHLRPGGAAVLSADYPELSQAAAAYPVPQQCFTTRADDVANKGRYLGPASAGQGRYALELDGALLELELPWRGEFMAENFVAAATAARVLGIGTAQIVSGLQSTKPAAHRFERYEHNGLTLVDDSYNANPLSMAQALAGVGELLEGRPLVLVLGEMRELGALAEQGHEELGRQVAQSGAQTLIWRGGHVADLQRGLIAGGFAGTFVPAQEADDFLEQWRSLGPKQAVVLFKGSRATHMEEFFEALRKELHA